MCVQHMVACHMHVTTCHMHVVPFVGCYQPSQCSLLISCTLRSLHQSHTHLLSTQRSSHCFRKYMHACMLHVRMYIFTCMYMCMCIVVQDLFDRLVLVNTPPKRRALLNFEEDHLFGLRYASDDPSFTCTYLRSLAPPPPGC